MPDHPKNDVQPQMLTVRQAAELLVVHEETIRRRIRDGRVPAIRIGSVYRVRLADVLSALAVNNAA